MERSKIKIIDLLNMISKGEEVPKKIKYENDIYIQVDNYCYFCEETNEILSQNIYAEFNRLNDEVEIIEEDKKITEEKDKITEAWVNLWEAIKEPLLKVAKLVEDNKELKLQLENVVEKKDKKIEKIGIIHYSESPTEAILHKKIDEIIDKLNEGKEGK